MVFFILGYYSLYQFISAFLYSKVAEHKNKLNIFSHFHFRLHEKTSRETNTEENDFEIQQAKKKEAIFIDKEKRIRFSDEHQVKEFHVTDSALVTLIHLVMKNQIVLKLRNARIVVLTFLAKENTSLGTSKELNENHSDSVTISSETDTESLDGNSESTEKNTSGLDFKDHGQFQKEDGKHFDNNEKFEDWESHLEQNFAKETLEIISLNGSQV